MLTERGIVIAYHNGIAQIQCQRQNGCNACTTKMSCGNVVLSDLTTEKKIKTDHIFTIETLTPLKAGQQVEIGLKEKSFILASFLLYGIPLFMLIMTTIISQFWFKNELIRVAIIVACTGFCFFLVKLLANKLQKLPAYQPILLRVYT